MFDYYFYYYNCLYDEVDNATRANLVRALLLSSKSFGWHWSETECSKMQKLEQILFWQVVLLCLVITSMAIVVNLKIMFSM